MALYSDARYSARVGLWAIRKWRVTEISMFILNPPWGNSSWCWVETWTGPRVRLQPPGIGHSQPPCFFRTRFHNQCNTLLPILLKKNTLLPKSLHWVILVLWYNIFYWICRCWRFSGSTHESTWACGSRREWKAKSSSGPVRPIRCTGQTGDLGFA
jgi:hypothetical protein